MTERRKAERHYKDASLQAWLDATAAQFQISAMVIADAAGLLVACGTADGEATEMAAFAARRAKQDELVTVDDFRGMTLIVRAFTWESELLYVCAKGEPQRCRQAVEQTLAGISRILSGV